MAALINPFADTPVGPQTPNTAIITSLEWNGAPDVGDTITFATHTSVTGNLLLFGCSRSNGGTTPIVSGVTWGGNALTTVHAEKVNGVGRATVYCGYIKLSTTGAQDLVITFASGQLRDFGGFLIDLDVMAASPLGDSAFVITNVLQSAQTITMTAVTDSASLLVGAVFGLSGDSHPFDVSAGWVEQSSATTGTADANVSGVLATRTADSTGSISLTGTSTTLFETDDWAAVAMELVPY